MIAEDKKKHFIVGFLISLGGFYWFPLFFLGIVIGALKEITYDLFLKRGTPEMADFVWTMYGSLLCMFIGFIASLF